MVFAHNFILYNSRSFPQYASRDLSPLGGKTSPSIVIVFILNAISVGYNWIVGVRSSPLDIYPTCFNFGEVS